VLDLNPQSSPQFQSFGAVVRILIATNVYQANLILKTSAHIGQCEEPLLGEVEMGVDIHIFK